MKSIPTSRDMYSEALDSFCRTVGEVNNEKLFIEDFIEDGVCNG